MDEKLKNVKIIFLDIDGTLYNSKKEVTDFTRTILNKSKQKGIYIVLCSGRSNSYISELSKAINTSRYVISNNGAFVYNYEDNIEIFQSIIKTDNVEKIWKLCESENLGLILETKEENYKNSTAHQKEYIEINNVEDIDSENIFQMVVNCSDEKKQNIKEILLNEKEIRVANYGESSKGYFFDVNNKNIDKGTGIENLIQYLGIQKEQTIGFGDGVNDIPMFRECGIRIAMGNAEQELKDVADYITLTNDEDGVARFIERYVLDR